MTLIMWPISTSGWISLGCGAAGICSVVGRWLLAYVQRDLDSARLERKRDPSLGELDLHAIVFEDAPPDWTKADEREWGEYQREFGPRERYVPPAQSDRVVVNAAVPADFAAFREVINAGPGRPVRIPPASEWHTEWQRSLPVISDPDEMFHSISPEMKSALWQMKKENRRLRDKLKRERAERPTKEG